MGYDERQTQSKTLAPDLVHDLWSEVKAARDAAAQQAASAARREAELNDLLARMQHAGMAEHLPSAAEIRGLLKG